MTVLPWDPVTADATSECPLVVTGLACLNGLELRSSGGGKAVSINDRPVAGGHFVSLRGRPAELREGLNWIKVTGGAADVAVRVRFFREPCEVPIRTPSQPPEDYRALDAIIALQQGGSLLPSLEEPVRRRIAQLFPNAGDPSRVAAVARLDLQRAANFDNVFDGLFAGRDPDWAFWLPKPDTIRHGRACMEARQAILQKYPDTWSSWHDLGYVLQNLRHLEAARHALVRALTIYPDALWSWYELHATDSRLFERTKSDRRTDARAAQRFRSAALRELDQVLRLAQGSPTELMKNPNWHRAFIAQMQRRRDEIDPRPRR
ncbi:MAG: hypothetical protein HY815_33360 [Candidatus Riflebacteria bacterium]|nr:hypothetical protein [Candidatus Riflebacteria bacterium]